MLSLVDGRLSLHIVRWLSKTMLKISLDVCSIVWQQSVCHSDAVSFVWRRASIDCEDGAQVYCNKHRNDHRQLFNDRLNDQN